MPDVDPDAFECRHSPPAAEGARRPRVELLDWCSHHPRNQALESYRASKHLAFLDEDSCREAVSMPRQDATTRASDVGGGRHE